MSDILEQLNQLGQPQPEHLPQIRPKSDRNLSALQEKFNAQIARINELKAALAEQDQTQELIRVRVQKEIQPLVRQLVALRIELVQLLDQVYLQYRFPRNEQQKLASLIVDISGNLLQYEETETLAEVHQRYSGILQEGKSMVEPETEAAPLLTLPEDTSVIPEEEINWDDWEQAQAQLEKQLEAEKQARQAQRAAQKKTKVELATPTRQKIDFTHISKASRKVYTNLAKLLHPDKEMDPAKRPWKEEAMKKVTAAYQQDDFFELLRLQMEFMQEQHLEQVPEDQLLYYVHLLEEQIRELESKSTSQAPEDGFYAQFTGSARQQELQFRSVKREFREELEQLKWELVYLQEPDNLRTFLKQMA